MLIHGLFSLNVLMFAVCIISIRPKHDNDTKSLMIFSVLFFDIDSHFPVFHDACLVFLFRIYSFFSFFFSVICSLVCKSTLSSCYLSFANECPQNSSVSLARKHSLFSSCKTFFRELFLVPDVFLFFPVVMISWCCYHRCHHYH